MPFATSVCLFLLKNFEIVLKQIFTLFAFQFMWGETDPCPADAGLAKRIIIDVKQAEAYLCLPG